MEKLLRHMEKLLRHMEKLLRHMEKLLRHLKKLLRHMEKLLRHLKKLLRHMEASAVPMPTSDARRRVVACTGGHPRRRRVHRGGRGCVRRALQRRVSPLSPQNVAHAAGFARARLHAQRVRVQRHGRPGPGAQMAGGTPRPLSGPKHLGCAWCLAIHSFPTWTAALL
eukprot:3393580-Pleurochrysis_carterae.AAC.1